MIVRTLLGTQARPQRCFSWHKLQSWGVTTRQSQAFLGIGVGLEPSI